MPKYENYPDIEPLGPIGWSDDKEVFLASIAVSLKRIADAMTNYGAAMGHLAAHLTLNR